MTAPMTAVERAIALRGVEAFREVPIEQLAHVASVAEVQEYLRGTVLFNEGDPAGSLYVILNGRIDLLKGEQVFADAGAGEPLGMWSLFDDHPRRATARIVEDARVLVVNRDDFYELLADRSEITRSLVQYLVRRLLELAG